MSMRRPSIVPLSLVTLALFIAALACGPTGGDTSPTNAAATPEKPDSGGPSGPGAVSNLEDVQTATIQIVAEGSLLEPGGALPNASWSGSGFIIDPSGIAVTNNHVVTGAARMNVLVGGEDEPRNARVLGVSECSDLAVIDIDGDGFPFLAWREGPVDVSLDVYAAGFPLGDPEFTMTRGIVSKARGEGDTSWTSVDYVLEHDASIQPGSSGGPLVDSEGRVVGVNYSGGFAPFGAQFYAIAQDEALPVIERLREGEDVNAFGLNGEAFVDQETGFSGIWVTSVKSGSVMDKAGVQPGDIISSMEGISLGRGGTMAEYCDVLKSHTPDDTLSLEVIRFGTGETLAGQLNGDELVTSFSFSNEVTNDPGTAAEGTAYSDYVAVQDDYGAIQMEVPTGWSDVDGRPETWDSGAEFASVYAAPSLDDFQNSWGTPGVMFRATADKEKVGGHLQMLDASRSSALVQDCALDQRYDYNDGVFRGAFDYYNRCGGSTDYMILSAVPIQGNTNVLIFVEIQIVNQADLDAADRILATFDIVGNLP
jgi:serine protease Do